MAVVTGHSRSDEDQASLDARDTAGLAGAVAEGWVRVGPEHKVVVVVVAAAVSWHMYLMRRWSCVSEEPACLGPRVVRPCLDLGCTGFRLAGADVVGNFADMVLTKEAVVVAGLAKAVDEAIVVVDAERGQRTVANRGSRLMERSWWRCCYGCQNAATTRQTVVVAGDIVPRVYL